MPVFIIWGGAVFIGWFCTILFKKLHFTVFSLFVRAVLC